MVLSFSKCSFFSQSDGILLKKFIPWGNRMIKNPSINIHKNLGEVFRSIQKIIAKFLENITDYNAA